MAGTLSVREGAGLYLVRRARTLTAPNQLRLLATAFMGVLAVDLVRISLARLAADEPLSWAAVGGQLAAYLAIATVLWRPAAGLGLAGAALAAGLVVGGAGTEPWLLFTNGVLLGARGTRRLRRIFVLGVLGYLALDVALSPAHTLFILGWMGGAAAVGISLGAADLWRRRRRDRQGGRLAEVAAEDARLRADERRVLARELHDVLTHQLSNVSLQVMSHLESDDTAELRRVLAKVNRSTNSALTELRLMVRVLRNDPVTAPTTDEVGELSRRVAPTLAAAAWARRLTEAGFEPDITISARADRLEMTAQATITRTLDICGDNILRHAPPRSGCTLSLSLNANQAVLRAANPLPAPTTDDVATLGWGLRGLRERVDLTGGAFSAQAVSPASSAAEWVVVVTLPLD